MIPGTTPPDQNKEIIAQSKKRIQEMLNNFDIVEQGIKLQAKQDKARYDALVAEGFEKEQALEIIKCRKP